MSLVLIRIPHYKQQKLTWANLRVAVWKFIMKNQAEKSGLIQCLTGWNHNQMGTVCSGPWWQHFQWTLPMLNTTGCCCHCGTPASWMVLPALLPGSWASDGPGHVMCSFLSKGHKSDDFILNFLSEAGVHHAEWGIPENNTGGWLWWQSG